MRDDIESINFIFYMKIKIGKLLSNQGCIKCIVLWNGQIGQLKKKIILIHNGYFISQIVF